MLNQPLIKCCMNRFRTGTNPKLSVNAPTIGFCRGEGTVHIIGDFAISVTFVQPGKDLHLSC